MYLYNERRSSVRQICAKLIQRGFDRDLVWSVVPNDTFEREVEVAERILAMKHKPTDTAQKMMANLYQKDFRSMWHTVPSGILRKLQKHNTREVLPL